MAGSVGKPLVMHEIGCSHSADLARSGPSRVQWWNDLFTYCKAHGSGTVGAIKHICAYHSNNNAGEATVAGTTTVNDWWLDDTVALKNAIIANAVTKTGPQGDWFNRF